MANLNGRDRGQIILVAAFALAVIFVTLALIVNSAIFTQNLASRGETTTTGDALAHQAMAEQNVGEALESVNQNYTAEHADRQNLTENATANISLRMEQQEIRDGQLVEVSYEPHGNTRNGTRIYQNETAQFSNDTESTYQLVGGIQRVDGANGTRAFHINASSLPSGNNTGFEVKVNRSGSTGNTDSWRMNIWEDSGDVMVRTIRNDGGTVTREDCAVSVSGSPFRIDVTGGTVAGEPCDALGTNSDGENFAFGSGTGVTPGTLEEYNITFRRANTISGNFSMVVNGTESDLTLDSTNNALGQDTNPDHSDALYNVTVRYVYITDALEYRTDIRVAPGEPDG